MVKQHLLWARWGVVLAALAVLSGACLPTSRPEGRESPIIAELEAEHTAVYPRGACEIRCTVLDVAGDEVDFRWSCTGGSLSGTGSVVTWQSPNNYGDYHVMVVVTDGKGSTTKSTLTIAVVPRPKDKSCCGR